MMDTPGEVTGPVNLGNPNEFTILELAQTILELTGSRSKIVHRPLPEDDPKQRRPDISKAQRLFDWHPTVPLKQGLAATTAYFDTLLASEAAERVLP
jgi:UDP-glucuronate decarboxylase